MCVLKTKNRFMKKWIVKSKDVACNVSADDVIEQLLANRGIQDRDAFFNPKYEDLADPFLMKDMHKAVTRIKKAKKVAIFGDYDADGVTGSVILKNIFDFLKIENQVYIPDRYKEGYGMNLKAIKKLAKQKFDLLITTDCGISDFKEVELANKLGFDVIITDHHTVPKKIPNAYAVINPKQQDCKYPFKQLAGVGVAFTLARAFNLDFEKWLLDLVAIGTVADCMDLIGENRIIIKYGLIVLEKTRNIGLKYLIPEKLDSRAIAFQIGPRLNAAGRVDHANTSYELLITGSKNKAEKIANKLEKNNQKRQRETEKVLKQVQESASLSDKKIIFDYNKNWPIGVLGLAAGKLCERYSRPVVLISKNAGSCRSIANFNIIKALTQCQEFFVEFGGHAQAAGFKIQEKNIKKFQTKLENIINNTLKPEDLVSLLEIDAEININNINFDLLNQINKFEPFGRGNSKPKFLLKRAEIQEIRCVGNGNQHLKMQLSNFKAIGFNCSGFASHLKQGDKIDIVFELEEDNWQGYKNLQLNILDLRFNNVNKFD